MTGWLILGGYLLGYLVTMRKTVWYVREHDDLFDPTDVMDRAMSIVLGATVALAWPFVLLVFAATRRLPKTSRELERERLRLQSRIEQLEREAGIR